MLIKQTKLNPTKGDLEMSFPVGEYKQNIRVLSRYVTMLDEEGWAGGLPKSFTGFSMCFVCFISARIKLWGNGCVWEMMMRMRIINDDGDLGMVITQDIRLN